MRNIFFNLITSVFAIIGSIIPVDTKAATEVQLYAFQGGIDGATPAAGLVVDKNGILYGVTSYGGGSGCGGRGCGTLFAIDPISRVMQILYRFSGGKDGAVPGMLRLEKDGSFFGTTEAGGLNKCPGPAVPGCGVVFKLRAPAQPGGAWTERVIYSFRGGAGGNYPGGQLYQDTQGDLFGTTFAGGLVPCDSDYTTGCGVAFELSPAGRSAWVYSVVHTFGGPTRNDAANVGSTGVAFVADLAGDLFGSAQGGGSSCLPVGCGIAFELTPPVSEGQRWSETVLHSFGGGNDGAGPKSGLVRSVGGNLFGSTLAGGSAVGCTTDYYVCGTVFELTPVTGGVWTENVLYNFSGGADGSVPEGSLVSGPRGTLIGTTNTGGSGSCPPPPNSGGGCGVVFELAPPKSSNTNWAESVLYSFQGGTDGAYPSAGIVRDSYGNFFGVTQSGGGTGCGGNGCGTVYAIVP